MFVCTLFIKSQCTHKAVDLISYATVIATHSRRSFITTKLFVIIVSLSTLTIVLNTLKICFKLYQLCILIINLIIEAKHNELHR